jgi:hypothetical protein
VKVLEVISKVTVCNVMIPHNRIEGNLELRENLEEVSVLAFDYLFFLADAEDEIAGIYDEGRFNLLYGLHLFHKDRWWRQILILRTMIADYHEGKRFLLRGGRSDCKKKEGKEAG